MQDNDRLEAIAESYHEVSASDSEIEAAIQLFELPWIKKHLSGRKQIIDLGIGDGLLLQDLSEWSVSEGAELTVIEGSKRLVDQYAHRVNATLVHGFFEEATVERPADAVLASHILEHVNEPRDVLLNCARWMAEDAILIGVVPNRESIHRRVAVKMGLQPALDSLGQRDELVGHQRVYSLETLNEDLSAAGFKLAEHRGFFLKPLSNGQMVDWDSSLITGLIEVSSDLPTEICANIGFVAFLR